MLVGLALYESSLFGWDVSSGKQAPLWVFRFILYFFDFCCWRFLWDCVREKLYLARVCIQLKFSRADDGGIMPSLSEVGLISRALTSYDLRVRVEEVSSKLGVSGFFMETRCGSDIFVDEPLVFEFGSIRLGDIGGEEYEKSSLFDRFFYGSILPKTWGAKVEGIERVDLPFSVNVGCKVGMVFPLIGTGGERGVLGFSFSTECGFAERIQEFSFVRDHVLEALLRIRYSLRRRSIGVSKRELEVLLWCAHGKTAWEISRILSCSEANVNFHVASAKKKLRVSSRSAAVAVAIKSGLIEM